MKMGTWMHLVDLMIKMKTIYDLRSVLTDNPVSYTSMSDGRDRIHHIKRFIYSSIPVLSCVIVLNHAIDDDLWTFALDLQHRSHLLIRQDDISLQPYSPD